MDYLSDWIFFAYFYGCFCPHYCIISIRNTKTEVEGAFVKSLIELSMVFATFIMYFDFGTLVSKTVDAAVAMFDSFPHLLIG